MDDIAQIAAEDAVVLVLTLEGKALLATLSQTVEIAPVVPAARLLAKIPADGSLVAELRAGDGLGCVCEPGVTLRNRGVGSHVRHRGQRTDAQTAVG